MSDPMDFILRAGAVKARVDRLADQARAGVAAGNFERAGELEAEMAVCLDSLHEIREEQLAEQLREREPRRRRWFRRRA